MAQAIAGCQSGSGRRENLLLRSLGPGDERLLRPHLKRVRLRAGDVIEGPLSPLRFAFFPETMIASLGVCPGPNREADIGMIGFEGMLGLPLLLGSAQSPLSSTVCNEGGEALAIRAEVLLRACCLSPTLHTGLLRFVHNFMLQMASTAGSMSEKMDSRIARWLLMVHDRSDGEIVSTTHRLIGEALQLRRAGVTECLNILEGDRVLQCTRGRIVIRDRERLELVAGAYYGTVERNYAEEFGGFGKSLSPRTSAARYYDLEVLSPQAPLMDTVALPN